MSAQLGKIDVAKKMEELKSRKQLENHSFYSAARGDEIFFIALMLHDKDCLVDAMDVSGITCDHFMHLDNAEFFLYLQIYYLKYGGSQLTSTSFREIASQHVPSTEVPSYISRYNNYDVIKTSPEDYARLKESLVSRCSQSKLFQVIRGGAVLDEIFRATKTDQHIAIQKLHDDIGCVIRDSVLKTSSSFSADFGKSLSDVVLDRMNKARDVAVRDRGLLCGLNCIDNDFLGFAKGKYAIILGFPNGGKTSMMLNFASNMARQGYKVCYVTVESSGVEVVSRLLSRKSGIPSKKMKQVSGPEGMTEELWNRFYDAKDEFDKVEGSNLFTITVDQGTQIKEVISQVEKYSKVIGGFDAVYFDYLEVFGFDRKEVASKDRRDLELAWISSQIQAWGKRNNVFVCSAQSITSEKIKEFRKPEFLEKAEKANVSIGVENVGGSQALTRDPDYVFSVVVHPRGGLIIYVTKARLDAQAGLRYVVGWDPSICNIYDIGRDSLFEEVTVPHKVTGSDGSQVVKKEKSILIPEAARIPNVSNLVSKFFLSVHRKGGVEFLEKSYADRS